MTKEPIPSARAMWEAKNHVASVKIGLNSIGITKIRSGEQFAERFMNLAYALFSASEISLFNEFKRIFPSYMQLISMDEQLEPPIGYLNHACLMQHNLMATVFQFYKGSAQLDDVKEACRLLLSWSNRAPDKDKLDAANSKLVKLAELIEKGKPPFFTISFKLPFSLPLPNGSYEIETVAGAETILIESFTATDVSSRLGDRHFSRVEVKVKGFTCTDNYWFGPDLENEQHAPQNIQFALLVINQVILNAKLLNETIRLVLASQNDIGTAATTQYDGDGERFHFSLALGFGGLVLVDSLSRQELSEEQVKELTERLKNRKLLLHEELYAQALIEREQMNLIGAFYLLNSATEAMIDYFLFLLSTRNGRLETYEPFMKGDSYCSKCELFNAAVDIEEPPRAVVPPSPFQKLKFLQEIGLGTASEVKRLQSMLAKIRNDTMRNELAHGRRSYVPNGVVNDAILSFQELRNVFGNLAK